MIKKVHYIQLTLLMLFLFVLFQITSISISFNSAENKSDGDLNYSSVESTETEENAEYLLITGEESAMAANIEQELIYLKKSYRIEKSLLSFSEEKVKKTKVIILASNQIQNAYNLEILQSYMKLGIHVIMTELPLEELDDEWKAFLGIQKMEETSSQQGIIIFSGFFLGGKQEYKNLKVDSVDIKVTSTCKTYIAGYSDTLGDEKYKNYNLQDIVWRNIYEGSQIYVVNGSFLKSSGGIGILSGILAQINQDFIYPVINAKALIINNAPFMTQENSEVMQSKYARTSKRFFEDLVLPNVIALCLSSDYVPTFYAIGSFDEDAVQESDYDTEILSIVQREMDKIGGELGISAYDRKKTDTRTKLGNTINLFQEELQDYQFKSLNIEHCDKDLKEDLVSEMEDKLPLTSVLTDGDDGTPFSLYRNNIVEVPMISEGFRYNEEEYFKLQSTMTALGIITHEVDMSEVVFPEKKRSDWANALVDMTSMINSYWKKYKKFDSLNISAASEHIYRFLTMKPEITIENNKISILIENYDREAYFVLRTEKKISKMKNASFTKLEDGAYLISAKADNLEITLK